MYFHIILFKIYLSYIHINIIPGEQWNIDKMSSTVTVKMNTCSKTHHIEVSMRDDGNLDVTIKSDCPNVQEYANRLKTITPDDIVSFSGSKVIDPVCRETLSVPCLVPIGVFDAAWMELGLLSKSLGGKAHSNEIILDENKD